MLTAISDVARKLLSTESEWNPKVVLGRSLAALLPESILHSLTKAYYSYLFAHLPDEWQEKDTCIVRHLVQAGDTVLDIGASIGGYTRFLADLIGPSGHVYSFEPTPSTYDYLSHNISTTALTNAHLYNCALSDREGTASIVIPRYRWGSECHYDATLEVTRAASECRRVDVPVRTLDSVLGDHQLERLSFIKCDVNYHELACLRGGMETLRRWRPTILVEVLPNPDRPGGPARAVFELLSQLGYEAYWFDGRLLHKRQAGERSQNYFFLTSERVRLLPPELVVRSTDAAL